MSTWQQRLQDDVPRAGTQTKVTSQDQLRECRNSQGLDRCLDTISQLQQLIEPLLLLIPGSWQIHVACICGQIVQKIQPILQEQGDVSLSMLDYWGQGWKEETGHHGVHVGRDSPELRVYELFRDWVVDYLVQMPLIHLSTNFDHWLSQFHVPDHFDERSWVDVASRFVHEFCKLGVVLRRVFDDEAESLVDTLNSDFTVQKWFREPEEQLKVLIEIGVELKGVD